MNRSIKSNHPQSEIMQQLRDPSRMRIVACLMMLLIGYAAIYVPLAGMISQEKRLLKQEETRRDLADTIDTLRSKLTAIESRIPEGADVNEWMQYVLGGVGDANLTLQSMTPGTPRKVGPMKAIELSVSLTGKYADFDSFLVWLETNERLFRVDSVKVAPDRDESRGLQMQVKVLGLTS
jgi:Tfp pilus assembly protein PilO